MRRKLLSIATVAVMAVTLVPTFAFAEDNSGSTLHGEDTAFTEDAGYEQIIPNEADSINDSIDGISVKSASAIYYKFTKTSQRNNDTSAKVLKVSADVTGKGEFHTTFSKSTSRTLSISLTTEQENKVKATISGSYGTTLSSTVGITVYKDKAKKGYLAFQPYRRVVTGKLKTYNSSYSNINGGLINTQTVTAKYPQKLSSGKADGNYYVKYY